MKIYNDNNYYELLAPVIDGEQKSRGAMPRNWARHPYGSYPNAPTFEAAGLPLMTEAEIVAAISARQTNKTSLRHIRDRKGIRSLDQDGWPYCWAFSTTKAVMMALATQNQEVPELSGWMLGAISSNYQNRGGWCQESLETAVAIGVATLADWPQGQVKRSLDTAQMRADAATRKAIKFADIQARNKVQLASCLLNAIPCMVEFNWWAHSVCALDILSWNPFQLLIDNSWSPEWDGDGMGILEGSRGIPDNACAVLGVVGT